MQHQTLILAASAFLRLSTMAATAETDPAATHQEILIVNACETTLKERWKASLDIRINDSIAATDIRIGETSPPLNIPLHNQARIELLMHGPSRSLALATLTPITTERHALVATGTLDEKSPINTRIIPTHPNPLKNSAHSSNVILLCTITRYPVACSLADSPPTRLPALVPITLSAPVGESPINLYFPLGNLRSATRQSTLQTTSSGNYLVVIHPSPKTTNRPALLKIQLMD